MDFFQRLNDIARTTLGKPGNWHLYSFKILDDGSMLCSGAIKDGEKWKSPHEDEASISFAAKEWRAYRDMTD